MHIWENFCLPNKMALPMARPVYFHFLCHHAVVLVPITMGSYQDHLVTMDTSNSHHSIVALGVKDQQPFPLLLANLYPLFDMDYC
jgi:hypothetical protein